MFLAPGRRLNKATSYAGTTSVAHRVRLALRSKHSRSLAAGRPSGRLVCVLPQRERLALDSGAYVGYVACMAIDQVLTKNMRITLTASQWEALRILAARQDESAQATASSIIEKALAKEKG